MTDRWRSIFLNACTIPDSHGEVRLSVLQRGSVHGLVGPPVAGGRSAIPPAPGITTTIIIIIVIIINNGPCTGDTCGHLCPQVGVYRGRRSPFFRGSPTWREFLLYPEQKSRWPEVLMIIMMVVVVSVAGGLAFCPLAPGRLTCPCADPLIPSAKQTNIKKALCPNQRGR